MASIDYFVTSDVELLPLDPAAAAADPTTGSTKRKKAVGAKRGPKGGTSPSAASQSAATAFAQQLQEEEKAKARLRAGYSEEAVVMRGLGTTLTHGFAHYFNLSATTATTATATTTTTGTTDGDSSTRPSNNPLPHHGHPPMNHADLYAAARTPAFARALATNASHVRMALLDALQVRPIYTLTRPLYKPLSRLLSNRPTCVWRCWTRCSCRGRRTCTWCPARCTNSTVRVRSLRTSICPLTLWLSPSSSHR